MTLAQRNLDLQEVIIKLQASDRVLMALKGVSVGELPHVPDLDKEEESSSSS